MLALFCVTAIVLGYGSYRWRQRPAHRQRLNTRTAAHPLPPTVPPISPGAHKATLPKALQDRWAAHKTTFTSQVAFRRY